MTRTSRSFSVYSHFTITYAFFAGIQGSFADTRAGLSGGGKTFTHTHTYTYHLTNMYMHPQKTFFALSPYFPTSQLHMPFLRAYRSLLRMRGLGSLVGELFCRCTGLLCGKIWLFKPTLLSMTWASRCSSLFFHWTLTYGSFVGIQGSFART